jgi:hypothetical protein
MLYDSTKALLRSILRELELPRDDIGWDEQIESGKQCLYELAQMSRPFYRAYQTETMASPAGVTNPASERLSRALPHVKSMLVAMRRKDRNAALASGRGALAAM